MDVILVPPHTVISTYPHDEETGEETYLYVLDRGYVSAFARLDQPPPRRERVGNPTPRREIRIGIG